MRRASHDDYDSTAAADRILLREASRITAGADAFHQLDPSEIVMRIEDFDQHEHAVTERAALRNEIFSGLLEYLFADGPDPSLVRQRIEGCFQSFHPELAERIRGPHEWTARENVAGVLQKHREKLAAVHDAARSRGALFTWNRELETEVDLDCVRETLVGLVTLLASEGNTWRHLTACAYCLAKAFRPALIAGMSLHDIAKLSGDEGGRATPGDRTQRLVNRRLKAAGCLGTSVHFQKSAATVEKYRVAQLENTNRKKSGKRKPSKKTKKP